MAEHMLRIQVSSSCKASIKRMWIIQNGSPLNIRTVNQISMKTTFHRTKKVMVQEVVNTSMLVGFFFFFFPLAQKWRTNWVKGHRVALLSSPQDEVILAGKNRNLSLKSDWIERRCICALAPEEKWMSIWQLFHRLSKVSLSNYHTNDYVANIRSTMNKRATRMSESIWKLTKSSGTNNHFAEKGK